MSKWERCEFSTHAKWVFTSIICITSCKWYAVNLILFLFYIMFTACANLPQSYLTLCDPMDCSPPGSSVHGILQARILEWVSMPSSRGSSWPRDRTCICLPLLHCRHILYPVSYLGSPIPPQSPFNDFTFHFLQILVLRKQLLPCDFERRKIATVKHISWKWDGLAVLALGLALLDPGCVILGKLLNLFEPQLFVLWKEGHYQ